MARYRSGLANIYLEDFITWLESQGYRRFMIRRHVRGVVRFTDWAEAEGLAVGDLDRGALNRLCSQLEERKSLRYPSGNRRYFCHSACLFVNFLEVVGAVEPWPVHGSEASPDTRDRITRHMLALSTYMGHARLESTYWYLESTPQLMADIADLCESLVQGGSR
jgi:hypothetical protein